MLIKLSGIESKISEALINNEIIHEDFTTIINEEKSYRELKECIGMMKNQRIDAKKIIWLKMVKENGLIKSIDKMRKYKTMLSYCLKCRKIQKI